MGGATIGPRQGEGGIDQSDVSECLGKVAQRRAALGVDLLGEEADVVRVLQKALERLAGAAEVAPQSLSGDCPEAADPERAFSRRKPVVDQIAVEESVATKPSPDRG